MTRTRRVGARARLGWGAVLLGMALLAGACSVSGLAFVQDDRVRILEPADNATVTLPLEVAWEVDGYDGDFGVFFDRAPMRPGQDVHSLVSEGDPCRVTPGCPDAAWLADRNIYVVSGTRLLLERLPDRRDNSRSKDRHDFTLVLLDEDGRRRGESAFTREFIVERD